MVALLRRYQTASEPTEAAVVRGRGCAEEEKNSGSKQLQCDLEQRLRRRAPCERRHDRDRSRTRPPSKGAACLFCQTMADLLIELSGGLALHNIPPLYPLYAKAMRVLTNLHPSVFNIGQIQHKSAEIVSILLHCTTKHH